jgi:WD40 repeat protein
VGPSDIFSVDWSPDGTLFAYGGNDDIVHINNGSSSQWGSVNATLTDAATDVNSVRFSYDS